MNIRTTCLWAIVILSLSQMACFSAFANPPRERTIQLWNEAKLNLQMTEEGTWQLKAKELRHLKESLSEEITKGAVEPYSGTLKPQQLTDILGTGIDLNGGDDTVITFFIGLANRATRFELAEGRHDSFLSALETHVKTVAEDLGFALNGYVVVASEEYEIAFMSWKSGLKDQAFADHTTRTGPQTSVLFEQFLAWEDPYVPFDVYNR